ncbi:hypothetical protein EVAR_30675_1 [Eumeta japonica]|uniref:Uncharacterized protein n=1 Tax=Eumeta variegata TaxID=151549 RepID=A0A4C1VSB8_EUMVA|nr:hypothetical protein EVAR_30675_1 [Eumeta japonica]
MIGYDPPPCSRWIPHNVTETQKTDCVTWCNAMLIRFREAMSNFVCDIVTGEEIVDLLLQPQNKATIDHLGFQDKPKSTKVRASEVPLSG